MTEGNNEFQIIIVIDTTEIRNRWSLDNKEWSSLAGLVEADLARVYLPEVVVRESIRHLRDQVQADKRSLADILKHGYIEDRINFDGKDQLIAEIDPSVIAKKFRERVLNRGFEILSLPRIDHQDLLNRDLDRRKPFSETGRGYRDALNWHSILELIQDQPTKQIYWVTSNSDDFGKPGLHPNLVEDISGLRNPAELELVPSLKQLMDYPALQALLLSRFEQLEFDDEPTTITEELVRQAVISAAEGISYSPIDFGIAGDHERGGPRIENWDLLAFVESGSIVEAIPVEDTVEIDQIERFDVTTTFATASVMADVTIEGFVYKGDVGLDQRLVVTDHDWNKHYAEVQVEAGRLRLTFNFRFEDTSIDSSELQGIEYVDN